EDRQHGPPDLRLRALQLRLPAPAPRPWALLPDDTAADLHPGDERSGQPRQPERHDWRGRRRLRCRRGVRRRHGAGRRPSADIPEGSDDELISRVTDASDGDSVRPSLTYSGGVLVFESTAPLLGGRTGI